MGAKKVPLVAMIKNHDFKEALDYLLKQSAEFKLSCLFEHAYLLHRLGRNQDALQLYASQEQADIAGKEHLLLA